MGNMGNIQINNSQKLLKYLIHYATRKTVSKAVIYEFIIYEKINKSLFIAKTKNLRKLD